MGSRDQDRPTRAGLGFHGAERPGRGTGPKTGIEAFLAPLHRAVERGDKLDAGVGIERRHGHLLGENGTAGQADEPLGNDAHPPAGRRLPVYATDQNALAEIEAAFVGEDRTGREVEALAVHGDLDTLGIGQVEHELVGPSKAIGVLGIADRLRVVEAVDVGPFHAGIGLAQPGLVVTATGADMAVAEREQRLAQQIGVGVPAGFDQTPGIGGQRRERWGGIRSHFSLLGMVEHRLTRPRRDQAAGTRQASVLLPMSQRR